MVVAGSQRMGPMGIPGTMLEPPAPKSVMPPLLALPACTPCPQAHLYESCSHYLTLSFWLGFLKVS